MPVLYLHIDAKVELHPANEQKKEFSNGLGSKQWVVANFKYGKKDLKIYHNEFVSGAHKVEVGEKCFYVIKGVAKMTIPPKSSGQFLEGPTEWLVENIQVTDFDESDPTLRLNFKPKSEGAVVKVSATLDKP